MSDVPVLPELKELVGAMLFASKKPVTVAEIRRALREAAETESGAAQDFAALEAAEIEQAVQGIQQELQSLHLGFQLREVANGFRLENVVSTGPWVRRLLEKGRPSRLSRPALETLAIIAYRQPCTRSEIEQVRGVAVDQIVRNLLELQLIRVAGRSTLPGRPWLFGTTTSFLEHFGLRNLDDLPGVDELKRAGARARGKRSAQKEFQLPGPDTEEDDPGDDIDADSAVSLEPDPEDQADREP